jgi:hypothetical protein
MNVDDFSMDQKTFSPVTVEDMLRATSVKLSKQSGLTMLKITL